MAPAGKRGQCKDCGGTQGRIVWDILLHPTSQDQAALGCFTEMQCWCSCHQCWGKHRVVLDVPGQGGHWAKQAGRGCSFSPP